jgi:threonine/homoserine/homoserine lactone efflux protein
MRGVIGHVVAVLPAFVLACVVLAALPGPATALFLHRTVRDGRSAKREDGQFGESLSALKLPSGRTPGAAFRASLVTVAANPKAAVFAFSFFPQFLPRHGPVLGTAAALAGIQVIIDGSYCALIVLLASRARTWLSRANIRRRLERLLGATLIGLGIDLAAATR